MGRERGLASPRRHKKSAMSTILVFRQNTFLAVVIFSAKYTTITVRILFFASGHIIFLDKRRLSCYKKIPEPYTFYSTPTAGRPVSGRRSTFLNIFGGPGARVSSLLLPYSSRPLGHHCSVCEDPRNLASEETISTLE